MLHLVPRIPRFRQQALCYHLYNRGVNRQDIFRDDADYARLVELLARYKHALCSAGVSLGADEQPLPSARAGRVHTAEILRQHRVKSVEELREVCAREEARGKPPRLNESV